METNSIIRQPLTPNQLAERVYVAVKRYCTKYAPARDADDLTHTVMVKLLLKAPTVDQTRPDFDPVAFAFGIAKYAVMNARRQGWRSTSFTDLAGEDDREFDPAAKEPEVVDTSKKDAAVNRVRGVLNELDAIDRKLIVSRFVFGRTTLGTAAKLGLSASAVAKQAAEAMGKVRELLEACP